MEPLMLDMELLMPVMVPPTQVRDTFYFLFDAGILLEGYGAPDAGYGAPAGDSGFNPGSSYDSPDSGYSAPQSGYSRGRRSVSLTGDQTSLYNNFIKPQHDLLQSPLLASLALRAPVAPAVEFARLS